MKGKQATPVALAGDLSPRLVAWIFAAWLLVLAFSYGAEVLARFAARVAPTGVGPEFLWAPFVDAALWTLVTLAVFQLTRRFPLARGVLLRNGAVLMIAGLLLVPLRNLAMALAAMALGGLRSDLDFVYLLITSINQDLFVYWLTVLAIHAVRHSRALQEREVARAQVETQLAQAQLQALKVQIQPHFLFNTLHAIATLVREDPARAERTVEYLSEMLRTTLAHHQAQEVTVREELETLRPYLEIEQVRLGERLTVDVEIDDACRGALVPHLILQPLVENAIRHGISPRRGPGRVRVAVSAGVESPVRGPVCVPERVPVGHIAAAALGRQCWLCLVVEDNGRGISGPIRPGAIGLANTRARLRQLYAAEHRFEIHSEPELGTRIEIVIPLQVGAGSST